MKELMHRLGNKHKNIKAVHVAGTNGKGSTCSMLASVLKKSGFKTGLFISPHLVKYTERFSIKIYSKIEKIRYSCCNRYIW